MITEFENKYTEQQKMIAKSSNNIEDDFNDLYARLQLLTMLSFTENAIASDGLYMHIKDIQDYLKGIEYKVLREKL